MASTKIKTARQDALSPQSFIVTGDIHAEWLRDAARQLSVYQPMVRFDPKLKIDFGSNQHSGLLHNQFSLL